MTDILAIPVEFFTNPLSWLILFPVLLAIVFPFLPDDRKLLNTTATVGSVALMLLSVIYWSQSQLKGIYAYLKIRWLPDLGINYILGADSLTWVLVLLTTFLVFTAIVASFTSIEKRLRLYYSMIFLLTASILGVFLARDLFTFILFWELELIPMYLLISIWGGPRREYAAIKFVLYTLFGSIFMIAASLGVFFWVSSQLGFFTFDFAHLGPAYAMGLPVASQILIFLGFFIGFAIKLPMVPFHTWLPDAHVEAPTPVSMLLAGILLKMGAYGMLRFCFGWFPDAAMVLAPYLVLLGVINIIYTAGVAMVQADLKKLIAYSSVSHMGFVLLGLGALNAIGFNGAVFQMISHGLISAGLFMMVGTLYTRTHTRMIAEMGGMGKVVPTLFFFSLLICLSSLGLPLLAGFPAETLVFYGAFVSSAFKQIPWFGQSVLPWSIQSLTVVSAIGVVLGAAYLLWMLQRVFMGPLFPKWSDLKDGTRSEVFVLAVLSFFIVLFGFFPNMVTEQFDEQVTRMAGHYNREIAAAKVPEAEKAEEGEAADEAGATHGEGAADEGEASHTDEHGGSH